MANTSVSIANMALTALATSRITSLTEDSEGARKVNAIYTQTRDALLEDHNWNFAREEAELSLLDETPVLGDWAYVYQLPSDCIRVIRMEVDSNFSIYGNTIYTNESSCKIEYVKKVTDEGLFSSGFVRAFAARLAMDLAYGITQSSTVAQLAAKNYQDAINQAKWSDAQEGVGVPLQKGSFINSRQL